MLHTDRLPVPLVEYNEQYNKELNCCMMHIRPAHSSENHIDGCRPPPPPYGIQFIIRLSKSDVQTALQMISLRWSQRSNLQIILGLLTSVDLKLANQKSEAVLVDYPEM